MDDSPAALRALAEEGLSALAKARDVKFGPGIPAMRVASLARPVLEAARRDPAAVLEGRLVPAEAAKRMRLLWAALRGTW